MNFDPKFNHQEIEKNKYQKWLDNNEFKANLNSDKEKYTIILPPPNVTGKLHLGHAWDGTLQDILIRYKKLKGFEVLWIPGMDHAGIATQAKVEERLQELGISRYDLGREEFLKKAWEWKEEYANIIRQQWGKMGFMLDYSQEKFTLDEDVNLRVNEVFTKLYEKGYIYQGYRIINWDPKAKTALSDIEVIHKEVNGKFYYLKYFLEDSNEYIEVATTRPETIFGDEAIAVHPDDERYQQFVGKKVVIPGVNRKIPIISDEYVEKDFGTGVVKITPAHDPNDYQVGLRHNLSQTIVMNLDGTMNELAQEFVDMDRFECRKKLIEKLNNVNLVIKIEDHVHNVGHSERSGVVVETILSKQWFVKMDELAKNAIKYQKGNEKIKFFPQRFEKTFLTWMENIQDWCISRQLWWGHQIPAWYHKTTNEIYVGITPPNDEENYIRDEDVLDTWFSSALWPMVTTIWRNDEKELANCFPTNTLVTGYDIIFFWVARMIFQAIEFEHQKPFDDVLIHGLIRAEDGRKMSKSLGNGIDPMDVIDSHGADALRLFLINNSAPGQDLRYSQEKLDANWNFLNKLWNITRFCWEKTSDLENLNIDYDNLDCFDRAILNEFNDCLNNVNYNMEKYEFGEVYRSLMNFIWNDFSSWYLEIVKIFINQEKDFLNKQKILKVILINIIKMLHPFCPFITDDIYTKLTNENIYQSKWPEEFSLSDNDYQDYEIIKKIIIKVRNFREENDIPNKTMINLYIEGNQNIIINLNKIKKLANINEIYENDVNKEKVSFVFEETKMHIINENLVDEDKKIKKLKDQKENMLKEITRSYKMLSNENFMKNANQDKINEEKTKALSYLNQYEEINNMLNEEYEEVIFQLKGVLDVK